MKIGVLTALFQDQTLDWTLDTVKGLGLEAVELGAGAYPGKSHCDPDVLLNDAAKRKAFQQALDKRGLQLSGLSCHGNPLHPNSAIAKEHHAAFEKTVKLAGKLGVERVITFSGCPGDSDKAKAPNWVTCPWPPDFSDLVKWQWNEKVIPYWKEQAAFVKKHGIKMICLEMHPGFVVYNPETLLCLREAAGDVIGANFDPSHLFWQGIDPVAAIRKLGPAIFHFHAKDCRVDPINASVNGVLDTKAYNDEINRSWIFRTVGYGHGPEIWKDMVSALKLVGYDFVLSIEHEDSLMSQGEGLRKAVEFLKGVVISEKPGAMWWA